MFHATGSPTGTFRILSHLNPSSAVRLLKEMIDRPFHDEIHLSEVSNFLSSKRPWMFLCAKNRGVIQRRGDLWNPPKPAGEREHGAVMLGANQCLSPRDTRNIGSNLSITRNIKVLLRHCKPQPTYDISTSPHSHVISHTHLAW